jgi:hypothetical protein
MSLLPLLRWKERKAKEREGKETKEGRKEGRKAASLIFVGQSEPAATSTVSIGKPCFMSLTCG